MALQNSKVVIALGARYHTALARITNFGDPRLQYSELYSCESLSKQPILYLCLQQGIQFFMINSTSAQLFVDKITIIWFFNGVCLSLWCVNLHHIVVWLVIFYRKCRLHIFLFSSGAILIRFIGLKPLVLFFQVTNDSIESVSLGFVLSVKLLNESRGFIILLEDTKLVYLVLNLSFWPLNP